MQRLFALALLLAAFPTAAQVSNLTAQLQLVFWKLPGSVQQEVTNTYTIYQRACRLSPSFAGVTTNVVDGIATVTTNNAPKTFLVFFTDLLSTEKVARVVAAKCEETQTKVERNVGADVVKTWTD